MFVEHPEFSDILVNLDTHTLVYSVDGGNDYAWDKDEKRWCGTEVDMGFDFGDDLDIIFPDRKKVEETEEQKEAKKNFDPKKNYLSQYCKYDEQLGKYLYCYIR